MDGLELYGSEYLRIRFQSALLDKVARLEDKAVTFASSQLPRAEFAKQHALLVGRFMLGVQNLLVAGAMEKNDSQPWTSRWSNQEFAEVIWDFYQARTDPDRLMILAHCLDGHETPAAVLSLSMLARMLDPLRWGILSWRVLACLGFSSMTALKQLRLSMKPDDVAREFESLKLKDMLTATQSMRRLTQPDLPTTASVAAALICVSLDLWPVALECERPDPLAEFRPDHCTSQLATV